MKRKALLIFSFSHFLIFSSSFAADNTGGLWTEVGVTKALPYNLSVEGTLEHRTSEWFDWSSRWNVGVGLNYRANKYLRLGLSYTYLQKHYHEELKYKYDGIDANFADYQGISVTDANGTHSYKGYNADAANWAQRHRLSLDITGTVKLRKTLRISLRERYQYTHQAARTVDRVKYRDPSYDGDGNLSGYDEEEVTVDEKSAKNRHLLRSRLKFSIDKKGWKFEPYVSAETHNDLANGMHLDKIRTIVGVDYSITKQHKVGLGYVFNHENDEDGDQNIHAISVGYSFKF